MGPLMGVVAEVSDMRPNVLVTFPAAYSRSTIWWRRLISGEGRPTILASTSPCERWEHTTFIRIAASARTAASLLVRQSITLESRVLQAA